MILLVIAYSLSQGIQEGFMPVLNLDFTPLGIKEVRNSKMPMASSKPGLMYSSIYILNSITLVIRCQSPKYENGFKHLWHLASGRAMNTNDENV